MPMARIEGVVANKAGLIARFAYWMSKRRLGRVIEPIRINAHHPRILRAMAGMEMGQEAAKSVPVGLKMLAQVKVAMMIGCPF